MTASFRIFELWLLKFLSFFGGCWFCFFLQSHYQVAAVLAAAATGFLGTLIPTNKRIDGSHVHANIYMGAFVAMGSKVVEAGLGRIFIVAMIGSAVYFALGSYFKGLGGKLGFIAFVSSLLSLALGRWL